MKFNKKGFVWYLVQQEGIFFMIGLAVGIIVAYLAVTDVIPVSQWIQICPVGK